MHGVASERGQNFFDVGLTAFWMLDLPATLGWRERRCEREVHGTHREPRGERRRAIDRGSFKDDVVLLDRLNDVVIHADAAAHTIAEEHLELCDVDDDLADRPL